MNNAMPPRWADVMLRMLIGPRDRQTVSGDLLEEYRECVRPVRGQRRADLWYVAQVAEFAWRGNELWAGVLGSAFVTRTAIDWLVPTSDFQARATVSMMVSAGIFVCVGFLAAWRSRSLRASLLAGVSTVLLGAVISTLGTVMLLAIWHDASTFAAITGSGGLQEVFTLPVAVVFPGAMLALVGGLCGKAIQRLISSSS